MNTNMDTDDSPTASSLDAIIANEALHQNQTNPSSRSSSNGTNGDHGDNDTFDLEFHRRTGAIDPPVDYMRMRHISPEHEILEEVLTNRVIQVLKRVRERHERMMEQMRRHMSMRAKAKAKVVRSCPFHEGSRTSASTETETETELETKLNINMRSCPFKNDSYPIDAQLMGLEEEAVREEQAIALFWAKASSLLRAAAVAQTNDENDVSNLAEYASSSSGMVTSSPNNTTTTATTTTSTSDIDDNVFLLHSACSAPSPFAIVRLCFH
jgi:hypothetical protein